MYKGLSMKFTKIILFVIAFNFFTTTSLLSKDYSNIIISKSQDEGLMPESIENRQMDPDKKADLLITQTGELHYEFYLPAGWSMISLPVMPNNASISSLFPEAAVIYGFGKGIGYIRINEKEDLKTGIGYWIYLNEEQNYSLTGQFIQEYDLLISGDGWYMIGGCSYPAQVTVDDGTILVIYRFVQGIGYQRINEKENLKAGNGYWISLSGVSELNVKITSSTIEWTFHKTPDNAHPDENEQQMVWLMNRARTNPSEEGTWLAEINDPDIAFARNFFKVDVDVLENEFSGYTAKPPAAFDVRLYYAAKEHSKDLIKRDAQDHNNQFDRITNQGFSFSSARGNVYSYSKNALHAHAGFNIDWNSGSPDGMLPGRGHRKAIMSIDREYTNVGIAMIRDSDPNTKVGPLVTTGNYCNAFASTENHYNCFLVGTVWADENGNSMYDPGEGIPEVKVSPDHGEYHALTSNSGGYAIPITSPGIYLIKFSGPFLNGKIFKTADIGKESLLMDLVIGPDTD